MLPRVAIIVLNFNGLVDTLECLQSIARITYPGLATILVDNASAFDPTPQVSDVLPNCRIVRSTENLGWAGGNNLGIRTALDLGAEYVLLLNNDTVVAANLIERMIAAARQHPGYEILGPVINDMHEPDRVQTDGCRFNDTTGTGFFQRQIIPIVTTEPPTVFETDIVNGCCLMLSERLVRTVGLIEEQFFLIHEESDLCLRARRAGFRCGIVAESLVWHRQSRSFERVGMRVQRYYDTRNLHLLLKRHLHDHNRGRTRWRSWLEYYKYAYYRYCIEREAGERDAADAVVEGVCDAWSRRFGIRAERRRVLFPLVYGAFEMTRRVKLKRQAAINDPMISHN